MTNKEVALSPHLVHLNGKFSAIERTFIKWLVWKNYKPNRVFNVKDYLDACSYEDLKDKYREICDYIKEPKSTFRKIAIVRKSVLDELFDYLMAIRVAAGLSNNQVSGISLIRALEFLDKERINMNKTFNLSSISHSKIDSFLHNRGWIKLSDSWDGARMDLWKLSHDEEQYFIHVPKNLEDKDIEFYNDRLIHFINFVSEIHDMSRDDLLNMLID